MIFPKILKKEYLIRSPIWNAYKEDKVLPLQLYCINYKLFSAYCIRQFIKDRMENREEIQKKINELSQNQNKTDSFTKLKYVLGMPSTQKHSQSQGIYLRSLKQIKQNPDNFIKAYCEYYKRNKVQDIDLLIVGQLSRNNHIHTNHIHQFAKQKVLKWKEHRQLTYYIQKQTIKSQTDINQLNTILTDVCRSKKDSKLINAAHRVLDIKDNLLITTDKYRRNDKANLTLSDLLIRYVNWYCTGIVVEQKMENVVRRMGMLLSKIQHILGQNAIVLLQMKHIMCIVQILMLLNDSIMGMQVDRGSQMPKYKQFLKVRKQLGRVLQKYDKQYAPSINKLSIGQIVYIFKRCGQYRNDKLVQHIRSIFKEYMQQPLIQYDQQELLQLMTIAQYLQQTAIHTKIKQHMHENHPQTSTSTQQHNHDVNSINDANQCKVLLRTNNHSQYLQYVKAKSFILGSDKTRVSYEGKDPIGQFFSDSS